MSEPHMNNEKRIREMASKWMMLDDEDIEVGEIIPNMFNRKSFEFLKSFEFEVNSSEFGGKYIYAELIVADTVFIAIQDWKVSHVYDTIVACDSSAEFSEEQRCDSRKMFRKSVSTEQPSHYDSCESTGRYKRRECCRGTNWNSCSSKRIFVKEPG